MGGTSCTASSRRRSGTSRTTARSTPTCWRRSLALVLAPRRLPPVPARCCAALLVLLVGLLARRLGGPVGGLGGGAPGRLGDAVHGADDGHRPAAQLPDAARHRLPAARWRSARFGPRRRPSAARGSCRRLGPRVRARRLELVARDPGLRRDGGRPRARRPAAAPAGSAPVLASGAALGAAPLVVARLIGASGARGGDGLERGHGAPAALAVGAGAHRPRPRAAGPRRPAGAAGRGRARSARRCRSPWSSLLAVGLLVAVGVGSRYAARAAARRLGGGARRRLLALAPHRARTSCATSTASTPPLLALAGAGLATRLVARAPAGPWPAGLALLVPWGCGEQVARAALARPGSRRPRLAGAVARPRRSRRSRTTACAAPTRACSSRAASRSRRAARSSRARPGTSGSRATRCASATRWTSIRRRPGCSRRGCRAGCRAPRASASCSARSAGSFLENESRTLVVFHGFRPPYDEDRPVPASAIELTTTAGRVARRPRRSTAIPRPSGRRPRGSRAAAGSSSAYGPRGACRRWCWPSTSRRSPLAVPWVASIGGDVVATGPLRAGLQWVNGAPRAGRQALLVGAARRPGSGRGAARLPGAGAAARDRRGLRVRARGRSAPGRGCGRRRATRSSRRARGAGTRQCDSTPRPCGIRARPGFVPRGLGAGALARRAGAAGWTSRASTTAARSWSR